MSRTSTPGTAAMELLESARQAFTLTPLQGWTDSTSSKALTVSIMHITVVNSLQTVLAYLAGTGAYRSIGMVPVAERSPMGANLA